MIKLNTHYYDGKLKERYSILKNTTVPELNFPDTIKEIEQLVKTNPRALQIVNLLKSPNGNYDSSNNIHVKELLPLIWQHVKSFDESGKQLFIEQLVDIHNGKCPQGRTTRLLQCVAF
jgi:hypothetical protein